MSKPEDIFNQISELKLGEILELTNKLKEKFGDIGGVSMGPGQPVESDEEATAKKTEFSVKIIGLDKLTDTMAIKNIMQKLLNPNGGKMGLAESKQLVDNFKNTNVPIIAKNKVPKAEAEAFQAELKALGFEVIVE